MQFEKINIYNSNLLIWMLQANLFAGRERQKHRNDIAKIFPQRAKNESAENQSLYFRL